MTNYIDGFVLPIQKKHLKQYKIVAEEVAKIWKEHGALTYREFMGEDLNREGTRTFTEFVEAKENEIIVFGWVIFDSKESRNLANQKVAADPRMKDLIDPLINSTELIFDAKRMVYGGFQPLVSQ